MTWIKDPIDIKSNKKCYFEYLEKHVINRPDIKF